MLTTFLHNPIVHGAISGLVVAGGVDLHAFRRWKTAHEAVTYDWATALLRWAQGAVGGALTAAGLSALFQ